MKTSPMKDFDCIRMKREAQERIYKEIKDLTPEQEITYFRNAVASGSLAKWWGEVKSRKDVPSAEPQDVE